MKIILFLFRVWIFSRSPGKLLWKGKQNYRISCFGIDFRYPLSSLLLQAGSSVRSGQAAQSFIQLGLELSKAEEALQAVWSPDCPQWNFFSYIQLESILSIYDSCLSFSYHALSRGAQLSCSIPLQLGRARLPWDLPEAVLYPGWGSLYPLFSSAHRTSLPALTSLVASTRLPQVCQWLKIPGQDYCRNNCRNKILNLYLSLEGFYTNSFSCCSLSKNLSALLRNQNLLSLPKMHCL